MPGRFGSQPVSDDEPERELPEPRAGDYPRSYMWTTSPRLQTRGE